MNNEYNNSDDLPVDVYRAYRRQRVKKATQAPVTAATDDDMASEIYRHYQNTRADRSLDVAGIDEIVQLIVEDQATLSDQPTPESIARDGSPVESSVHKAGRFRWLKGLSNREANDSDGRSKAWLGVAAAALIGLALFPLLGNKSPSGLVPAELAQNVDEVVPFIDSGESRSIGFSSYDDGVKTAFQYGVLAIDLALYEQSRDQAAALELIRSASSVNVDKDSDLSVALDEYAGDADTEKLISSFEREVENSGNQPWFTVGHSVETILLSARYALATSDSGPLVAALDRANTLELPEQDNPAKRLFSQLLEKSNGFNQSNDELRQIVTLAEQIKSLMH